MYRKLSDNGIAIARRDESARNDLEAYREFIKRKVEVSKSWGFDIRDEEIHPLLKYHQRLTVKWAVAGGRRAMFSQFGLGKTLQQLECVRLTLKHARAGKPGLIVAPLGVRQEFKHDAGMVGIDLRFIRRLEEIDNPDGIYLTNYETVRDGKLDPSHFAVTSLDECDVLRGFGGTKTFREFMRLFEPVAYRYLATATPDPNEYIELLAYAAYLGIMDVSAAKTRFFKRDSTRADQLTVHPHKAEEFWMWVASWALFLNKPSDIGGSDEGYELPEMEVIYHEIRAGQRATEADRDGQYRMYRDASLGVVDAAREKRDSLPERLEALRRVLAETPGEHHLIWHDLEAERDAIEDHFPDVATVYGKQDLDERERIIIDFSQGQIKDMAAKPVLAGAGCNFQKHCHIAIFLGIGFKFRDFIQAVHRIHRFLQSRPVQIHLIYTDNEREVLRTLQQKWERHNEQVKKMAEIIREYGLSELALAQAMCRSLGVERVEVSGNGYRLINNDLGEELLAARPDAIPENSVHLILTSIPFGTMYEYSPNYADLGHTDDPKHFFEQMDFYTPRLLRVLKPGRLAAIHVKDRIVPGGLSGLGFQTVYPFHADCIAHFTKHGFAYMGMKTIVTDVVRENNQTYRLGWTEQCKDGTKMGVGMPEYLLIFRKPPTENVKSYADEPVVKLKRKYSRSRWQIDAHGFTRSSGNRLLTPEELLSLPHHAIFKLFREYSLTTVYDFEHHVKLGEALEAKGILPVTFMLLQPPSWHADVWTDITRMQTLNGAQSAKGREMHLCPMQFDLADRAIQQWTMEGETVLDPFAGLMTVPYRAVMLKRKAVGVELSPPYFLDGCAYVEAGALQVGMPSLFDAMAAAEDCEPEEQSMAGGGAA